VQRVRTRSTIWQQSRRSTARFGPAFVLALVACCVAHGQDVRTNYLPGTDFSKYHTYKWVTEVAGEPVIGGHPDQILDAQIKQAIDSQLSAKGFTETDSDNADLFLTYRVALGAEKQWTATGWGDRPWGPGLGMGMGTATSSTIAVGALVLDVYDPAAKHAVWIGLATQTLDPGKSPEKNQKKLDKAMKKLLKDFPPGRK
jgi:Domain of unknown function (DUF4136)